MCDILVAATCDPAVGLANNVNQRVHVVPHSQLTVYVLNVVLLLQGRPGAPQCHTRQNTNRLGLMNRTTSTC
jgi:hypothetical protein